MPGDDHGSTSDAADVGRGASVGGEVFGPYRLEALLGRGGMGEVWRAFDTRRERTVALKRLTGGWADVPSFQARFRLEARATARLDSEHVIVIHDYGEIDGRLFIDMRLVGGGDLAGLLRAVPGGLAPGLATNLCVQIADGLDAAHRTQLIHRDVKPSNVLLARDAGGQRAYLVDFGIAKLADELTGAGLTATGSTLGTPAYMAPELFEGAGSASVASDVYALGCVLFEMLTGRRVFQGGTVTALMNQHFHQVPPAPSSVHPELAAFDPVLARALAKDPRGRQPSAGTLAREALAAYGTTPPGSRAPVDTGRSGGSRGAVDPGDSTLLDPDRTDSELPRRSRPGTRRIAIAIAAVLVAAAAATVGVVVSRSTSTPAPPTAAVGPVVPGPSQRLAVSAQSPNGLAFSPDGRRAYIADGGANAVLVVDTAVGTTVATVPVGSNPDRVAVAPDGRHAYITNFGDDQNPGTTVSVLDTATNAVTATIPVGQEPLGVVVSPDGRRAYVADSGSDAKPGNTVSVLDLTANTVTATVPVGDGPTRLGISPDGTRLYVPDYGGSASAGSTLTVVDTASSATSTLPAGDSAPTAAVTSPDGRRVYIVCIGLQGTSGSVQVLDTVTHTLTPLGTAAVDGPLSAALAPDGRTLVVTNYGVDQRPGSAVSAIDTATGEVHRVTVGGRPFEVSITPDGRAAWVTTTAPAGLARIPLGAG